MNKVGPFISNRYRTIGPDIEAEGWGQKYSSPYVISPNPDFYHGPWMPNFVRGRHKFRTQPRVLGRAGRMPGSFNKPERWSNEKRYTSSVVESAPFYAHGVSGCNCELGAVAAEATKASVSKSSYLTALGYLAFAISSIL